MDPPVRPSEELKVSSAAGRLIEVRRSVHESGRIELPRNGKTRRVDMSQQLADELRWLHASRVRETLKKGWAEVPVWVFCNEDGKPLWKSNVERRVFHRTLTQAGLRRVSTAIWPGGTTRRRWYVIGRHLSATEHNSGATDRSVTPRQVLVELRGLEPLTPRLPALCSPN